MNPRVFSFLICLAVLSAQPARNASAETPDVVVILEGTSLRVKLPRGWKLAEKTPERAGVLGAFQSGDNTSSLFVSPVKTDPTYSLPEVLDEVVKNFETGLIVNWIGKTKAGELAGVPAVFATLEVDVRSDNSLARMGFRFYLTVFEWEETFYLMQGSVQKPVKAERETEVLTLIRSLSPKTL
jgi:hypothetical protein